MAIDTPPVPLREEDYDAIEAAVMETARGRWFLSEYTRRNRTADTNILLDAIGKLERSVTRQGQAPDIDAIKFDLADMAAAIARTKEEISRLQADDSENSQFEMASSELDAIVGQTESATSEILNAAETIQEIAWTLRESQVDDEQCDVLDARATEIYMACSFQDLTGQRIQKVVQVIKYLEGRINAMMDIWGLEEANNTGSSSSTTSHQGHDTRPDAHLLNGPQLAGMGVDQDDVDLLMDHKSADDIVFDAVDLSTDEIAAEPLGSADEMSFASVDDLDVTDMTMAEEGTFSEAPTLETPISDDGATAEVIADDAAFDIDDLAFETVDTTIGTDDDLSVDFDAAMAEAGIEISDESEAASMEMAAEETEGGSTTATGSINFEEAELSFGQRVAIFS